MGPDHLGAPHGSCASRPPVHGGGLGGVLCSPVLRQERALAGSSRPSLLVPFALKMARICPLTESEDTLGHFPQISAQVVLWLSRFYSVSLGSGGVRAHPPSGPPFSAASPAVARPGLGGKEQPEASPHCSGQLACAGRRPDEHVCPLVGAGQQACVLRRQRHHGGAPAVWGQLRRGRVLHVYLTFFLEDDDRLEQIRKVRRGPSAHTGPGRPGSHAGGSQCPWCLRGRHSAETRVELSRSVVF